MRLQVASCHRLLLLLINLITQGLSADQKKHDFRRSSSGSNSVMDTMMKKYSYPKIEVTAGIGYGHHLHPFYYRGQKEMMYPCAVECGEWETMTMDDNDNYDNYDNANDASSNVDVVTVHPDVSTIEITTSKSLPYKDISSLRPKKYQSTTAATPMNSMHNDFAYQDSKGADVKIIPHKSDSRYLGDSNANKDQKPNDGSLYAKYYDALVSGYDGELASDSTGNKENEFYDPVEESIKYNPPSFTDAESDDMEAPVYPSKTKSRPERNRVEEKYVKHNVREERLEDVRTNSFGPYEEDEDYSTDSSPGKQSGNYNPSKYIDDYAAPITSYNHPNQNYEGVQYKGRFAGSGGGKPFRPSPPQSQAFHSGEDRRPPHLRGQNERLHPFYDPRNKTPHQDSNGYSDYQGGADYGVEGETDYDEPPPKSGAYFGPVNYNNKPGRNNGKKYPHGRVPDPRIIRRPSTYGRNRKYPQIINGVAGNLQRSPYSQSENFNHPAKQHLPSKPYHGSYPRSTYSENGSGHSYYPYAPRHGYLPQNQEFPVRSGPGGIRVVSPPRIRAHSPRHGKFPNYTNSPYVRGQRISFRQIIPQKNGFTKIIKNYRSVVDHTPKRYVGSDKPYVTSP